MNTRFIPYIMLDGNANEAIAFYEKSLGAKVMFKQTFGEGPESVPADAKDRVAHAVLKIGEVELFVADTEPGASSQPGNRLSICITTSDKEQSTKYYEALRQGGQINQPLQEIYFSPAYA